jgi:hypothetical protein
MKIKNKDIYADAATLDRLKEEYEMIGFTVLRTADKITVLTRKPKKQKEQKDQKPKRRESKRAGARLDSTRAA